MWFSIMLADFRQRSRARSFRLTVMLTSAVTFLLFPAEDAAYAIININGYRGIYNSAYIGDSLSLISSLIFPLFGFYLIKNALYLDRKNQVDRILAASPMDRFNYLSGKILSNFMILTALCLTISITAIIVQLYRGESYKIDLVLLFKPQLILVIPTMLVTSCMAVMFESTKALRNSAGNVVFMLTYPLLITLQIGSDVGAKIVIEQLENAVGLLPFISDTFAIGGIPIDQPLATFLWEGTQFNNKAMISLFYTMIFCLFIFVLALLFYRRYSPISFGLSIRASKAKPSVQKRSSPNALQEIKLDYTLPPPSSFDSSFRFFRLIMGEFRLLARGKGWWWYMGAITQGVAALILPLDNLRLVLLPVFGIWSILPLSKLGCRDYESNTRVIVAYNLAGAQQRLASAWFASATLMLLLASGLMARFIIEGQASAAWMLLVAILFIPMLALFLGRLTRTTRTFEMVYLLLWYIGPVERIETLDFLGTTYGSENLPIATYIVVTGCMLITLLVSTTRGLGKQFFSTSNDA